MSVFGLLVLHCAQLCFCHEPLTTLKTFFFQRGSWRNMVLLERRASWGYLENDLFFFWDEWHLPLLTVSSLFLHDNTNDSEPFLTDLSLQSFMTSSSGKFPESPELALSTGTVTEGPGSAPTWTTLDHHSSTSWTTSFKSTNQLLQEGRKRFVVVWLGFIKNGTTFLQSYSTVNIVYRVGLGNRMTFILDHGLDVKMCDIFLFNTWKQPHDRNKYETSQASCDSCFHS